MAKKFGLLLERHRRPDGRQWNGQDLQDATGGIVTRSYVSALRKGNIENPGFEKLRAIAKAMGFPPELWFEEDESAVVDGSPGERDGQSIAERLEHLFEVIPNEKTGESYTSSEVARMSLGDLDEEEVEGIRSGRVDNPTVEQVLALSEAFSVSPSYFLERGKKQPLLDGEAMKVLADKKSLAIANKSLGLSEGEKDLVMEMMERLGHLRDATGGRPT